MISVALVCTTRPVNCASIGISRCPRSISTHSDTRFGRPRSNSPFIAARIVRPVYNTSSTITRSMLSTPNGICEDCRTACDATFDRSSRYNVMSSVPTGTSTPSIPRIACAIRCARGTPRRRIPISARCFVPAAFLDDFVRQSLQASGRFPTPTSTVPFLRCAWPGVILSSPAAPSNRCHPSAPAPTTIHNSHAKLRAPDSHTEQE